MTITLNDPAFSGCHVLYPVVDNGVCIVYVLEELRNPDFPTRFEVVIYNEDDATIDSHHTFTLDEALIIAKHFGAEFDAESLSEFNLYQIDF